MRLCQSIFCVAKLRHSRSSRNSGLPCHLGSSPSPPWPQGNVAQATMRTLLRQSMKVQSAVMCERLARVDMTSRIKSQELNCCQGVENLAQVVRQPPITLAVCRFEPQTTGCRANMSSHTEAGVGKRCKGSATSASCPSAAICQGAKDFLVVLQGRNGEFSVAMQICATC